MEETHLYQQIIAAVRSDILAGRLKPGDRLPSLRQMTDQWGCTVGTVQRAYAELAGQGLVVSRAGQGTHVTGKLAPGGDVPLRRAGLVNRAEAFLLETLTAGYSPVEVEAALLEALERWQVVLQQPSQHVEKTLRFVGSHDPALVWLAAHFGEIAPGYGMQVSFSGSRGGLIALVEGQADLAGCHLWDPESGEYNIPYIQRLLPNQKIALITLAHRRLGLIVAPGNPYNIQVLADLARPGVRFVNRQAGSGTRVWLDAAMSNAGIMVSQISGYEDARMTHSEVAACVAGGQATVGFGLQTAALSYGLDFIDLVRERYDLAAPAEVMEQAAMQRLAAWLATAEAWQAINALGGYDTGAGETFPTGAIHWLG